MNHGEHQAKRQGEVSEALDKTEGEPRNLTEFKSALSLLVKRDVHQAMYERCPSLMADVVLNLEGNAHRTRKRLLMPLYRRESARALEDWVTGQLLPDMDPLIRASPTQDLVQLAQLAMLRVSVRLLGLPPRCAESQLLQLVDTFSASATAAQSTEHEDALTQQLQNALTLFNEHYFQPHFARARSDAQSMTLLPLLKHGLEQGVLDNIDCLKEAAFFLQASLYSTANALVHGFHELAGWFAERPNERIRFVEEPLWAQRCVAEALRLHPASPVMVRRYQGDQLDFDLVAINQDRDVFGDDASRFDPYRRVEALRPYSGLTFGVGHHSCPGRELAAGLVRTEKRGGDEAQIGVITRLLVHWMKCGLKANPNEAPVRMTGTTRLNWASYPVVFDPGLQTAQFNQQEEDNL